LSPSAYRLSEGRIQFLNLEEGVTEHKLLLSVVAERSGQVAEMFGLAEGTRAVAVDLSGAPRSIQVGAAEGAGDVALKSRVFPNPFVDVLAVSFSAPLSEAATLDLFDVMGRSIYSLPLVEGTEVTRLEDLNLPSGTYLLRVTSTSGQVLLTEVVATSAR